MINLLPPEHKQRNRLASLSYLIALVYIVIGVLVFLGAAALATYNLTASAEVTGKQDRIAALAEQKSKNNEIASKASFIEDRIKSRSTYQESFAWESVLDKIAAATPNGIQLKSLKTSIDAKTKKTTLSIQGSSPDRRSVLLFQNKLSTDTGITTPFVQALNEVGEGSAKKFDFTIEMGVQTNVVKK